MTAFIKNIHIFIILAALIQMGVLWWEHEEQKESVVQEQSQTTQTLEKTRQLKRDLKKFEKDIQEQKEIIERVASQIEKIQQQLPSEISDTENISMLRKIAEDINIKEVSIVPEKDDMRGFYIARKYRFKAKATFVQFLIMFEKIGENKRILNIGEVSFGKIDQPQRSKFQLINGEFILEAYKYNVGYKEDRGLEQEKKGDAGAPPPKRKPRKNKEEEP